MTINFIAHSAQPFNTPLNKFRILHPGKRLVVGVAIVASVDGPRTKLLLLQRAETEDAYPLMYELPGGAAEPDDLSLLATVVRETEEETGLVVNKILATFPGFEYETSKGKAIQFNFLVAVELDTELNVRLNPEEHCTFVWVDNTDDLSRYPMTEKMLKVVSDALAAMAETTSL